MTVYLTRDELLDLHLLSVERWGGRLGIRSQDRLLASLQLPQQVMFGAELYPDLADKVAVLGFQLLKHRPFFGGNEATALLAMLQMLAQNGVVVDGASVARLADLLRQVLHSSLSRDQLAAAVRHECERDVRTP